MLPVICSILVHSEKNCKDFDILCAYASNAALYKNEKKALFLSFLYFWEFYICIL